MTFDGSLSTGSALQYKWAVKGGTAGVFPQAADSPKITVRFAQPFAAYTVELTVTDGSGTSSTTSRTVTYMGR